MNDLNMLLSCFSEKMPVLLSSPESPLSHHYFPNKLTRTKSGCHALSLARLKSNVKKLKVVSKIIKISSVVLLREVSVARFRRISARRIEEMKQNKPKPKFSDYSSVSPASGIY